MSVLSWIDIAWSMIGAACFTLAAIHLVIWLKQRDREASLFFALTSWSVGATAIVELLLMRASTPEQYMQALRWGNVLVVFVVIGIVGYVRRHYRIGNAYLAAAVCLTRVLTLVPVLFSGASTDFSSITTLDAITVWGGESMVRPLEAATGPWLVVDGVSSALLVLFIVGATFQAWRRPPSPDRSSVLRVCGTLLFFTLLAAVWSVLVTFGDLHAPLGFSPAFICVVAVMGYELGNDMLRASELARRLLATQVSLHDTQRRMEQAVVAGGVGFWNWNIADGESWLSPQGRKMWGFSPDANPSVMDIAARLHADDRMRIDECLRDAARADGNFDCEYRVKTAETQARWFSARGKVHFDAARSPMRLEAVLVDVTDLKKLKERFQLVVETAPVAILMVDPEGFIALCNARAAELFGYIPAELTSMAAEQIIPARFRIADDRHSKPFSMPSRMKAGHEPFGLHKDGTSIALNIALNPMEMDTGMHTLVSVFDIRELIRMERESLLQREELAHLSRVAMLSELSSSLAHELNQPLTAILSNAQAAIRFLGHASPNLEEVRDSLLGIVESDKRAGEVIRRLRALLRKERSNYRLLDLNEVVLDVLQIIRSDLLNRGVVMILELTQNLPPLHADKVQLQQVLLNLIRNASDAMDGMAGERRLVVTTAVTDSGECEVTVCDVGSGIQSAEVSDIFTPFMTTKTDGLGLGLPVCVTIIEAHRGRLWARNNNCAGATVGFSIPQTDSMHDARQ